MGQKWFWIVINTLIRWRFPRILHLNVKELHQWLQQSDKKPPLLIDGRTLAEYEVSHLKQAYFMAESPKIIAKKFGLTLDDPIVVYCSIGYRSALIAQQLQGMGYRQVFNLKGSLFQWVTEGYEVYQGEEVVHQIHPYNRWWQWSLSLMTPSYYLCTTKPSKPL